MRQTRGLRYFTAFSLLLGSYLLPVSTFDFPCYLAKVGKSESRFLPCGQADKQPPHLLLRPVRRLLVFHASSSHSRSLPSFANTNKILTTQSQLEFAPLAHRIPVLFPIVPAQLLARRDGAQREHVQARRRQPVIMQQACGVYEEHTQCRCRSLDDVQARVGSLSKRMCMRCTGGPFLSGRMVACAASPGARTALSACGGGRSSRLLASGKKRHTCTMQVW